MSEGDLDSICVRVGRLRITTTIEQAGGREGQAGSSRSFFCGASCFWR